MLGTGCRVPSRAVLDCAISTVPSNSPIRSVFEMLSGRWRWCGTADNWSVDQQSSNRKPGQLIVGPTACSFIDLLSGSDGGSNVLVSRELSNGGTGTGPSSKQGIRKTAARLFQADLQNLRSHWGMGMCKPRKGMDGRERVDKGMEEWKNGRNGKKQEQSGIHVKTGAPSLKRDISDQLLLALVDNLEIQSLHRKKVAISGRAEYDVVRS